MKIKTHDYNSVIVLELQGELESDSAEYFEQSILQVISKKTQRIVLHMAEVDFIDSIGLSKLLWAKEACSEKKCQFRLACLTENCLKILEITGLANELATSTELSEAVKSFV